MATEQDLTEIAGVPALLNQEWLKLVFCPFLLSIQYFSTIAAVIRYKTNRLDKA
jgi:hypothetical protein